MSMYNLLEYILKYSDTTYSLWFYSRNEATKFNNYVANTNNFKSFKYNLNYSQEKLQMEQLES